MTSKAEIAVSKQEETYSINGLGWSGDHCIGMSQTES